VTINEHKDTHFNFLSCTVAFASYTARVQRRLSVNDGLILSAEFAVHDMLLPDIAMVHGRLVVTAWEFGLDGVQDDAVRMLTQSVEVNCFSVIFASYQLRHYFCRCFLLMLYIKGFTIFWVIKRNQQSDQQEFVS
jgi:hypothetical protein